MKDKSDTKAPSAAPPVDCAQCGTRMVARPAPDERELMKTKIAAGSQHHYAANFAASMHEKEREFGLLYECPACHYQTRVKAAA